MGNWNPSLCKTRTYLFYIVNIMGADVLAMQGARASAKIIFTMLNWNESVTFRVNKMNILPSQTLYSQKTPHILPSWVYYGASLVRIWEKIDPCYNSTTLCWFLQVNSWNPGRFEWNIFKLISVIDARDITCEIVLKWISLDLSDDKSTLVQVMAWCHQATSHYLSQCSPISLSPYGVIRPQMS